MYMHMYMHIYMCTRRSSDVKLMLKQSPHAHTRIHLCMHMAIGRQAQAGANAAPCAHAHAHVPGTRTHVNAKPKLERAPCTYVYRDRSLCFAHLSWGMSWVLTK